MVAGFENLVGKATFADLRKREAESCLDLAASQARVQVRSEVFLESRLLLWVGLSLPILDNLEYLSYSRSIHYKPIQRGSEPSVCEFLLKNMDVTRSSKSFDVKITYLFGVRQQFNL